MLARRFASVGPVAHLLGAEAVHLEYPTQVVFDSVTLGVNDGARIGIVGRNGDGKSSLLGLLTGQLRPGITGTLYTRWGDWFGWLCWSSPWRDSCQCGAGRESIRP